MKPNWKISLAAVLCTCAMLIPPKAQAVEIPPEVQAEFDRLMSIGAGDILDQYLSTLSEKVRDALMAAEEAKNAVPTVSSGVEADPGSASCGVNLGWDLDSTGTLTITGSGEMLDFRDAHPAPWYAQRESITAVVLGEEVATIGSRAFADCTNLQTVAFPDQLGGL